MAVFDLDPGAPATIELARSTDDEKQSQLKRLEDFHQRHAAEAPAALAALLLVRHREGDANVRSVWLCTRNDLIQSLVVAATGVAVWLTASRWPDLIAGAILAVVFLLSFIGAVIEYPVASVLLTQQDQ